MKNYNTFAEMEALLKTAIELPGSSIKDISAATAIKPNTLYKWKSNENAHLSPQKADALLLYFIQNEPERLLCRFRGKAKIPACRDLPDDKQNRKLLFNKKMAGNCHLHVCFVYKYVKAVNA